MLTPSYTTADNLNIPDPYRAMKAFILRYAPPLLDDQCVIQGWQNRSSLPEGTNEYAVISILNTRRRGTTRDELVAVSEPDSDYRLKTYYEAMCQVDFCSDSDNARVRAFAADNVFRSLVGVNYFERDGIAAQYAENIRELSFVDEASQFVRRYALTFHIAYWSIVNIGSSWFNDATLNRVEDVDSHHPPTES